MREVLYKSLTSLNSRKKDISLREVFEKDGVTAKTERRCFYFIKDVSHLDDQQDLQKWLNLQNQTGLVNKRHFYIMKEHKDDLGEDKLVCKIAGTFYAVVDQSVYTIAFLHSFKVRFMKSTMSR